MIVKVIGAGLAGCEAAWYLANKGYQVKLYEQRPVKMTAAHHSDKFAELVCSNSLRSNDLENACGILKAEMKMLDSLIISAALANEIPAGSALAVDREGFSSFITAKITSHPNISVINEEVVEIIDEPTIIATGPLTEGKFADAIVDLLGCEYFNFFDAAAPIINVESIDQNIVYLKSRYDKGEAAYLNCPMTKEQFQVFYDALIEAECVELKDFENNVFEGCMPIEVMAKRGIKTMLYGPLKPVGLEHGDNKPYAVVQLRQDNAAMSLYNIVGFQTHLKWGEQKRVFRLIPGLENAEFERFGVMHKNSYLNSPTVLKQSYQTKVNDNIFFAGQITGVEGYVESAASGINAAINIDKYLQGQAIVDFPKETAFGALSHYITHASPKNFQPMNISFGIIRPLEFNVVKAERKKALSKRALQVMNDFIEKEL